MNETAALDSLQDVLESRNLHVAEDKIRELRPSDHEELENWLSTYAQPATLLSKEEYLFSLEITAYDQSPTNRHHVPDKAFECAIETLESSIASIDEQCRLLESHKQALSALRGGKSLTPSAEDAKHNHQKAAKELAQLELDNESIATSTHAEMQTHHQNIDRILADAAHTVSEALEKDDRVLNGLQKIVPRMSAEVDERLSSTNIEILCNHWIALTRRAVRHHIDETYEQALRTAPSITNGHVVNTDAEDRAVRAELDELRSEIDGLVALVAEHHFRGAISKSIKQAQLDIEAESAKWSEYTACVLLYLTARLEALSELYEHSHVHKAALKALEEELESMLIVKNRAQPQYNRDRDTVPAGRGLKPLRLVQATLTETQETTSSLFRLLNVKTLDAAEADLAAQILASVLRERSTTVLQHLERSSGQFSQLLSHSILTQDPHLQRLLQTIHVNSSTASVQLVKEEVQTAMKTLENRTDSLAAQMHALDVDELARHITAQI